MACTELSHYLWRTVADIADGGDFTLLSWPFVKIREYKSPSGMGISPKF